MARSRMIKPEFWDDEKLATQTSRDARLTFIGLWNHSDDYGVVKGNPVWLKNHIFPYEDSLSIQKFKSWLSELEKGCWVIPFEASGEKFYFIRNFSTHQVVNRPSKQRNPIPPDNITNDSLNTHGILTDETETETETEYSSEPQNDSEQQIVISIPLVHKKNNGNSKQFNVTPEDFEQWQDSYPGVDVMLALKDIRQWNFDNPTKRKTSGGIRKHISTWLSKAQNQGKYKRTENQSQPKNRTYRPDIPK